MTLRSWFAYAFVLGLSLSGLSACGSRPSAPTLPNGHKVAIMLFIDRSAPEGTPPEKLQQLQQVSDWMEPDLLNLLRRAGYDAASVVAADGGNDVGRYTLHAQIVEYSGGSKALRYFVGFGAGAARLAVNFTLLGPNNAPYVTGTPAASTGRTDWERAVRKVNQEIVAAVNVRLRQSL